MSQSPESSQEASAADSFQQALASLDRMIFQGRSFSGRERNCAFLNLGGGRFADLSAPAGLDFPDDGRALALTDWDQDGDVDLWLVNRTSPQVRLLRNNAPPANRYLSLRLEGRTVNRDAIGARVEVTPAGEPSARLVKSVRAGDGFLAQSSKTLLFGLGTSLQIEKIVVRWPGQASEEFEGVVSNRSYRLVQGTGRAREIPVASRNLKLVPKPIVSPVSPSSESRLVLAARVPLAPLTYRDFKGTLRPVHPVGEARLINLWASWCGPCRGELSDFAREEERLSSAGLKILALSVDGLGEDGSSPAKAREFIEGMKVGFATGMADTHLLETLETLDHRLVDVERPFPIPTSFLIDPEGSLAAIYRGPVEVDRLAADLELLSAQEENYRLEAVPMAGRWASRPPVLSLSHIAQGFLARGMVDEAAFYLKRARRRMERMPNLSDPVYADASNNLGVALADSGRVEEALPYYREALRKAPSFSKAHNNLGVALISLARISEAVQHFRSALEANPEDAQLHSNLGTAQLRLGRFEEAEDSLKAALRLDPDMARTLFVLATLYANTERRNIALETFRQALALAESESDSSLAAQIRAALKELENR